ncbi:DUF1302 domain-containing protein [Ketobacter alkanivorans]|uniref:Peptide ABC transporter substrate-binding protein n=1 Tax=Ketobacter alkanivorans TaxID=1917421 RepID=A0A2K9LLG3_9GAMM|nr:DUF1302 domain-containing protein [Ketobacter alkanivorans]AUM13199.1 hypothetical protein Kalk_12515 [Ketobacter alkanivorans]
MAMNKSFKVTALAAAVAAAGSVAPAYGYEYVKDDFRMQVDTTVSVGASWRADDRDYRGVGTVNAAAAGESSHLHGTGSQDNSNQLWKKGSTFSEVAKVTMDLEMNYKNYGAFIRGKAFYDNRIVNGDGVTDLPAYYRQDAYGNPLEPAQSAGTSADILDAFVWGDWWLGDKPLNVRLGKQVISWGEGLFFPNGINTINPIDVNALLAPGSELKDALIPLNALYGSIGLTSNLTLEAFVLFDWKETELPECGTFFSTTDLAGANCYGGFFPGGAEASYVYDDATLTALGINSAESRVLPRGADGEPDDQGQYGVAARYFVDSIETEFALYYINYHSRTPLISGHMIDPSQAAAGIQAAVQGATGNPLSQDLETARLQMLQTFGTPTATAFLFPTADFFNEYPEDIQLLGASFNTTIDIGLPGGATAFSGEISMRKDQPFQLEDGDTVGGALGLPSISCHDADQAYDCYNKYEAGEYAPGFVTSDYYQAEIAFIHFFDRILGASRWTAILDVAGSYVDLPSKDEALLNSSYNATLYHPWVPDVATINGVAPLGTYPQFLAGNEVANSATAYEDDYYPTSGAWGYKMRFTGEYNNVFAGINLRPTISFSHDVYGTTPGPITNFLEDRKALGLSVEAVYQNSYTVDLSYTDFYGAEPYNQLADRDYYSISASASF